MSRGRQRSLADLEQVIGRVLRIGTVTSSLCLAVGLVLTLAGFGGRFAGPLLAVGLIVLLATPAARVVVSVFGFVQEREWTFVALTLIVLLALAGSVVAAFW